MLSLVRSEFNFVTKTDHQLTEFSSYNGDTIWQTYISNNERIVHLKPRPAIGRPKAVDLCPDSKSKDYNFSTKLKSGGTCEECGKHLPDERNCFCSITCKVTCHV